jgi:hypothetical protein
VNRPAFRRRECVLITLLTAALPGWREPLLLVKPETVLRWHREGFRSLWHWKSRPTKTLALIRRALLGRCCMRRGNGATADVVILRLAVSHAEAAHRQLLELALVDADPAVSNPHIRNHAAQDRGRTCAANERQTRHGEF